jgi:hypothetical protein
MRLLDIAQLNIPTSSDASSLRGARRLLRDLAAAGLMQDDWPSAAERLESKLDPAFSCVLVETLSGAGPEGLRPRRAA